jgi:hypothetical protein
MKAYGSLHFPPHGSQQSAPKILLRFSPQIPPHVPLHIPQVSLRIPQQIQQVALCIPPQVPPHFPSHGAHIASYLTVWYTNASREVYERFNSKRRDFYHRCLISRLCINADNRISLHAHLLHNSGNFRG